MIEIGEFKVICNKCGKEANLYKEDNAGRGAWLKMNGICKLCKNMKRKAREGICYECRYNNPAYRTSNFIICKEAVLKLRAKKGVFNGK